MRGAISKTKIAREKCVKAEEAIKRYGYVYVLGFLHRVKCMFYICYSLVTQQGIWDLGFISR